jgi:hypothetical protein
MHLMHGAGCAGTLRWCRRAQDVWSPDGPQGLDPENEP